MERRLGWFGVLLAAVGCAATSGNGEIVEEEVSYRVGRVPMEGYLAYPAGQDATRPGVLVVHEWWGHNEYARRRARMLAEMGYTALAVDMYGEGKQAEHPEDAGAFASAVMGDLDVARARFEAAQELLEKHPTTDPDRTAAIGYCFGGGVVLHMARAGLDLEGVASFHGSLGTETPAEPGEVEAEVLVLHGGSDPLVPDDAVAAFEEEMEAAGVDYELVVYPDAKHAFTNPGATELGERFELPLAYDAEADAESWAELEAFLERVFGE